MKMMKNRALFITVLFLATSCSISPGMNMDTNYSWNGSEEYVETEVGEKIPIERIDYQLIKELSTNMETYRIGIGDKISVTVWGLDDIFPMVGVYSEQNLRIVKTDGTIFFPYAGEVMAAGKTQVELRKDLTDKISNYFTDPQLDVSIVSFESQRVYLLGEVTRPQKLSITETPLSLADALGQVYGLNTNTSAANQVFIIRQGNADERNRIFRADMSSPSAFLIANEFYLAPQDIVYVNASSTAKWNRVISQFFPFSTFLNSIDNLTNNN